jgi:hypothetical protein
MPNLNPSDLRDPQPPLPGERERALVSARAHELGRRRRLLQGGGALALVAALAVSVAALTAGGSSSPGGSNRVEAASSGRSDRVASAPETAVTTAPPTTVAPTPGTTPSPVPGTGPSAATVTPPAATTDTTPAAPVVPVVPVVPATFTFSGVITGNPANTTATILLHTDAVDYPTTADAAGNFSISGVPAGDYLVVGGWVDASGTASQAQKLGMVSLTGDSSANFVLAP